jgi:hypothetical protein
MIKHKQVVILQIDGLSYVDALEAIKNGHMPFLKKLLKGGEYEILKYRSGIPSTTPYVQAGILYGDNSEIPSFRWWDRKRKKTIQLMGERTFYDVRHNYFKKGSKPLLKTGVAIASLFAGGSKSAFAVSYVDKGNSQLTNSLSKKLFLHLLLNPMYTLKWHWHTLGKSIKIGFQMIKTLIKRRYADWIHFPLYMLDQLFLYFPTLIAIKKAIGAGSPITYAGFYAYDNVAHIFGQKSSHGNGILKDIDNTVRNVAKEFKNRDKAELIILSDHGETSFRYIAKKTGKTLSEHLAEFIPEYRIDEYPGKTIIPKAKSRGTIALTFSGGLAHFYDKSCKKRLMQSEIQTKFPGLLEKIVKINAIAGIMVKDGLDDLFITADQTITLNKKLGKNEKKFLEKFDKASIIAKQLIKLNSFDNAGDIILIGQHIKDYQISFEPPVCGHGSIGGNQAHPFIFLKKSLGLDAEKITDAKHLHPFFHSLIS